MVTTQQTVLTQDPHITCFGNRFGWQLGYCIVFGQARGVAITVEQTLKLFITKAHQLQIEVSLIEFGNLKLEQLFVPASVCSDAVVGQDVGFLLNCGEVAQLNHGHFSQCKFARCSQASVSCDHAFVPICQDRIGKTKLGDGCGNLCHLVIAVGAGVSRIRDERIHRDHSDLGCHRKAFGLVRGVQVNQRGLLASAVNAGK